MMKYLFFILIIYSTVFAEDKDNSKNNSTFATKQITEKYTKALTLYKQKKYQESYELFNSLFENNLDNVNINFYLGRSAFELKKYHDSIIAFERILFSNPESTRTKLELGRAFFMSKQYNESKKYFNEVLQDDKLPAEVRVTINKFLAVIDNAKKKNFLNGVILVGLNYDSNINNQSDTYQNTGASGLTDWAHQEVLILNHKYILNDKSTIKNDFMLFSKSMKDRTNKEKDVQLFSYTPSYSINYGNGLTLDYGIFADSLWLGGSTSIKSFGILPKYTYAKDKNMIFTGQVKYQKKNNVDKTKDSKYFEVTNSVKYIYNTKVTLGSSFIYAKEAEEDVSRDDINKDSYNFKVNSTYLLNPKFSLASTFSYKYSKYKDIQQATNPNTYRVDDEYKLNLVGTYIYSPKWLFQINTDYTKNDSTYSQNIYKKHTFTFNIIRPF